MVITVDESSLPTGPGKSASSPEPIRVMVVDDSAVIRGLIARTCQKNPALRVVTSAANGELAIKALKRDAVDVIILDIEMPVMDGFQALPQLKTIDAGVQIIMASTLTQKNADISLRAMALGATDYIPKPSSSSELLEASNFSRELIEKVTALGQLARRRGVRLPAVGTVTQSLVQPVIPKKFTLRTQPMSIPEIIAIGSSTGGPQALFTVTKALGPALTQPIVITQHMPPSFTTILAEHITKQCGVTCFEAKEGDILKGGNYYLAPGDHHMTFVKKPEGTCVRLTKDPPESFCRPAVDPMLRSLVSLYGKNIWTVMLTGMGADGCKGSEIVVQAGGSIIAQDEMTSVVWGMPGAVAMAGLCTLVLPLSEIGPTVKQCLHRGGP